MPRNRDELLYAARRHDGAAEDAYLAELRRRQQPLRELEDSLAKLQDALLSGWRRRFLLRCCDALLRFDRWLKHR